MNIGITSVYFDRGSGVICQQIKQAIQWHVPNCNISILARMSVADNKKQIKYWDDYFHPNILLHHSYQISDEDFEQWIIANKLDIVIFVEEQHTKNLLPICNKLSIKSINYIVWENFNPAEIPYYKQFTYLVCPTKSSYNLLKNDYMLDNTVYVPWGVDLDTYQFQEPIKKDKPLVFFPAGFGGVNDRKNEDAVIKAFSYICPRDKMNLHIHTQKEGQAGQAQGILKTSGSVDNNQLIIVNRPRSLQNSLCLPCLPFFLCVDVEIHFVSGTNIRKCFYYSIFIFSIINSTKTGWEKYQRFI